MAVFRDAPVAVLCVEKATSTGSDLLAIAPETQVRSCRGGPSGPCSMPC
jgi:hypothetical protein